MCYEIKHTAKLYFKIKTVYLHKSDAKANMLFFVNKHQMIMCNVKGVIVIVTNPQLSSVF